MYGRRMCGRHALACPQATTHAALRELVDERIAHVRGDARLAAVLQLEDRLDHLIGNVIDFLVRPVGNVVGTPVGSSKGCKQVM